MSTLIMLNCGSGAFDCCTCRCYKFTGLSGMRISMHQVSPDARRVVKHVALHANKSMTRRLLSKRRLMNMSFLVDPPWSFVALFQRQTP